MPDGSLLVAGGGDQPDDASDETRIFRLPDEQWQGAATMNHKRFYPTCTSLPDGRVLAVAGRFKSGFTDLSGELTCGHHR